MKAQVLYGINNLKYESDYQIPELSDGYVLVKVKACGICGSDVDRVLKNGTYHFPTIIGHEFSGIVEKNVDEEGQEWVGKRVSVFPLIPCRKCPSCLNGNYQLCESYDYLGSRSDGGFAEYVKVPVWNLLEIPQNISYETAAMMEPASVALHALNIAGNVLGKNVVITGAGTIASILAKLCISAGAANILLIARNPEKLTFIKSIVSKVDVLCSETDSLTEDVNKLFNGLADIVIEGTGASNMMEKAISLTSRQGTVVLMGNPSDSIQLDKKIYWQILRKELVLKGTWNSSFGIHQKSDWVKVFSLFKSEKLIIEDLITHRLKLNELYDGIMIMKNKSELSSKIMVVFDE